MASNWTRLVYDMGIAFLNVEVRNSKGTKGFQRKCSCLFRRNAWWKAKIFKCSQPCKKHYIDLCEKIIQSKHTFACFGIWPWCELKRRNDTNVRFRFLVFWGFTYVLIANHLKTFEWGLLTSGFLNAQCKRLERICSTSGFLEAKKGISASLYLSFPCRQYRLQAYLKKYDTLFYMADDKENITTDVKEIPWRRERGAWVLECNCVSTRRKWMVFSECTSFEWTSTMK